MLTRTMRALQVNAQNLENIHGNNGSFDFDQKITQDNTYCGKRKKNNVDISAKSRYVRASILSFSPWTFYAHKTITLKMSLSVGPPWHRTWHVSPWLS